MFTPDKNDPTINQKDSSLGTPALPGQDPLTSPGKASTSGVRHLGPTGGTNPVTTLPCSILKYLLPLYKLQV